MGRRQGGQRKRWEDNIKEWKGLEFTKSQRAVKNSKEWRKLAVKVHDSQAYRKMDVTRERISRILDTTQLRTSQLYVT